MMAKEILVIVKNLPKETGIETIHSLKGDNLKTYQARIAAFLQLGVLHPLVMIDIDTMIMTVSYNGSASFDIAEPHFFERLKKTLDWINSHDTISESAVLTADEHVANQI